MPWFPDFISAVEQARMETRAAARADPVAQYITALNEGTTHDLETAWPGEVIVHDPRAGTIRGHRRLRTFVEDNKSWLAGHHARIETVASTRVNGRAVVELLAHLTGDGPDVAWPVAVVAESTDALSVVFRTYCSQQPVDGRRHVRPPILKAGQERPSDVVGRYHAALDRRVMSTRSWTRSRRTATTGNRSAPTAPTAALMNCVRSSPGASAQAAASASRRAW